MRTFFTLITLVVSLISYSISNSQNTLDFDQNLSALNATAETTLQIGVPGQRPQDGIQGLTISTNQIDNYISRGRDSILEEIPQFQLVLNRLENEFGVAVGDHVTRTLANEAFADIEEMRIDLNAELRRELLRLPEIRSISNLDVNLNPLKVRVVQFGTNLKAELSNLSLNIDGRARLGGFANVVCGTFRFSANLSQGRVSLTYNARTGQIINRDANLSLNSFNVNCSNPIGDFVDIFVNERKLAERELMDAVSDFIDTRDFGDLFSIDETLASLDAFCVNVPEAVNIGLPRIPVSNNIPSNVRIPGINNLCRSKAGAAVDLALSVLDGGFEGSGFQIDFTFLKSTNSNFIQLVASHNAPTQRLTSQISGNVQLDVKDSPNSRNTETYVRFPNSWNNIKAFGFIIPGSGEIFAGQFPNDTAIVSIGENRLISGLYSLPTEQIRTEVQAGCLNIICEDPNSPTNPGPIGF